MATLMVSVVFALSALGVAVARFAMARHGHTLVYIMQCSGLFWLQLFGLGEEWKFALHAFFLYTLREKKSLLFDECIH